MNNHGEGCLAGLTGATFETLCMLISPSQRFHALHEISLRSFASVKAGSATLLLSRDVICNQPTRTMPQSNCITASLLECSATVFAGGKSHLHSFTQILEDSFLLVTIGQYRLMFKSA